jgi:DNA-binding transcriptional LysR family regulator
VTRPLPPLDLIRGFEAAARQLSFTKAAAELFLTQSAVSRQVQALEDHLGVALFERRHREIRLTDAGQQLYRTATEALRLLTDTAARIRRQGATEAVTVTCSIGFASLWLVPRPMEFRELHPEIDIRIDANNRLVELDRDRVEVAVRYCPKADAPAAALQLFEDEVYAVCSPALLARSDKPLDEPADLRHHVLLHYQGADTHWAPGSWRAKLETLGLHDIDGAGSLHFNQYDQLIQAALEGQGVALGVGPLVRRHLQQGRLVTLFGQRFASPRGYYLLTARHAAARPEVTAFTDWLRATALREVEATPPLPRPQRASPGRSERDSSSTGTSPTSTIASDGKAASARRSSRAKL